MKILFVCLGNICRSPSAEAVFNAKLKQHGLTSDVEVDSAGTSGFHEGDSADSRMMTHADKRAYNLTSISRQIRPNDFDEFDMIIAMDASNFQNLMSLAKNPSQKNKIAMMTDFSEKYNGEDVPDPYYGGSMGFERVLDILEDCAEGLIDEIKNS